MEDSTNNDKTPVALIPERFWPILNRLADLHRLAVIRDESAWPSPEVDG